MQNYTYPSSSQVTISGIGDPTGLPVPPNAVYMAGDNPGGNLTGVKVDTSGHLLVDIATPATAISENLTEVGGAAITLGQKVSASSLPVVLASDQSSVHVTLDNSIPAGANIIGSITQSGTWTVQPGNTANTTPWLTTISQGGNSATVSAGGALKVDASGSTQPVSGTVAVTQSTSPWVNNVTQFGGSAVVTGTGASGVGIPRVTISNDSSLAANQSVNMNQVGGSSITLGQKTSANSMPVVIASDQSGITVTGTVTANAGSGTFTTSETTASTSSVTSVASSASSVSLLASNASRKNATFFNDSTSVLYLKLGATASTTSYTVQIPSNGYYELPVGKIYTGVIDGIWSSANGNARITELT